MKRRVKEILNGINIKDTKKLAAILTALSMSFSSGIVMAQDTKELVEDNNLVYEDYLDENIIESVLESIYQNQMEYLVPTISKLKEFYETKDTKDIIKNGYDYAYDVINIDLDYYVIYNGTDYTYRPKSINLMDAIEKNNMLIHSLKIKALGNGRDPEYGVIKDNNTELGFRIKTEEDKKLIDEYTEIVGESYFADENILRLINGIKNNDDIEELLLAALDSTYDKQMAYIYEVRDNLKTFYEEKDSNNIIKEAYPNAYNSFNEDLNAYYVSYTKNFIDKDILANNEMTNKEMIDKYIELVKRNNGIINSFRIKTLGNARDTDYGVIKDSKSELGFRIKTEEDKQLIDEYSECLKENNTINYDVIRLFEEARSYNLNRSNIQVLKK